MISNFIFLALDTTGIIIVAILGILLLSLLGVVITKYKYKSRYRRFYKRLDKTINKKYNGNMLIENLINEYTTDDTNTFKSLKSKGKKLTKRYLEYFFKNLPEQVLLKSFISADKNKSELVILVIDENDRVLYQWEKSKKVKGLLKAINKYQMLTPMIAYLYELPVKIDEGTPYRLVNHENDNILAYEIVKNSRKAQKKYKEKKLTKKEKKELEKKQKALEKKKRK